MSAYRAQAQAELDLAQVFMQPVGGDLAGGLMVQGGSQGSPVCSAMSEARGAAGSLNQKASIKHTQKPLPRNCRVPVDTEPSGPLGHSGLRTHTHTRTVEKVRVEGERQWPCKS
jgi:hypothetical protein